MSLPYLSFSCQTIPFKLGGSFPLKTVYGHPHPVKKKKSTVLSLRKCENVDFIDMYK